MAKLSLVTQSKRHPLKERGADLYETPPCAIQALLQVETLPPVIWEPCAGPGSIVTHLRQAGHHVIAQDLYDWDCPDCQTGLDFLSADIEDVPSDIGAIVTNPPFKDAAAFVRKARDLCPKVIMLVRLAFIESVGRADILDEGDLARIYVFANRLPMMHRHGWQGNRSTSAVPFAWFVWDAEHAGPTHIRRIRWEKYGE